MARPPCNNADDVRASNLVMLMLASQCQRNQVGYRQLAFLIRAIFDVTRCRGALSS
jgi:hypothetical protein